MEVKHPRPLTRSQRLVLSLLNSDWMTGPDLAAAVRSYMRAVGRPADATPQGVHRTVASLVARGYVEKYRVHGIVRFRVVPDANRGPDRRVIVEPADTLAATAPGPSTSDLHPNVAHRRPGSVADSACGWCGSTDPDHRRGLCWARPS